MIRPVRLVPFFLVALSGLLPGAEFFIVLRDQPSRSLIESAGGASRLRLLAAESDEARSSALLETRQSIARELEARFATGREAVAARVESLGGSRIRHYRLANMIVADLPDAVRDMMAADPAVGAILPAERHEALLDTSVAALGAPAFWNLGVTGASQAVAVLDSGIRTSHPAFAGRTLISRAFMKSAALDACFDDDPATTEDVTGHGTHVAGIVASQGTPQFPKLIGVARGLGTLVNLKVGARQKSTGNCNGRAAASSPDVIEAIEWAYQNTAARIFNYSYGGRISADDSVTARLLDFYADAYDLLFVVAAGNDGPGLGTINDPGIAYNPISVANIDHRQTIGRADDGIHPSSSRGPTAAGRYKPDIAAPGTLISSAAWTGDGFLLMTGTSMAAPHIAGAAALLRQAGIASSMAIKAVLINTASGDGWKADWAWGSADLDRAQSAGNVLTDSAGPAGQPRFFTANVTGDLRATLTWNRHIIMSGGFPTPSFTDLDLGLYSRQNGATIAQSIGPLQNVEQVRANVAGDVVLKVASPSTVVSTATTEPFALASTAGFRAVSGPALSMTCSPTSGPVTCQVSNTGDLDAHNIVLRDPSGRAAALGSLAPGATLTRSLSFEPPASGQYSITLASSSYGQDSSLTVQVQVGGDGAVPLISAGARDITFRYRAGGPPPAQQAVPVQALAPLGINVTASSTGWLAASADRSTAPAVVTLAADPGSLAPGEYQGSVTIAGPNNAQTLDVTLLVDSPVVANRMMTLAVPGQGCAVPATPSSSFQRSDAQALVWFAIDSAAHGDRPAAEWVAPSGNTYLKLAWDPIESPGTWCLWAWLDIAGTDAASKSGDWTVKVTWNDSPVFVLPFKIE